MTPAYATTLRNASLAHKCQRCGRETNATLCPECTPRMASNKIARSAHSIMKHQTPVISLSGLDIHVNGVFHCRCTDYFEALKMKPVVAKRFGGIVI